MSSPAATDEGGSTRRPGAAPPAGGPARQTGPESLTGSSHRVVVTEGAGAGPRNAALAASLPYVADAGAVLVVEADAVPPPTVLAAGIARLDADPDLGAVLVPGAGRARLFRVRALRSVLSARAAKHLPGPMEVYDPDVADPNTELLVALQHLGWRLDVLGRPPLGRRSLDARGGLLRLLATVLGGDSVRRSGRPVLAGVLVLLTLACLVVLARSLILAGAPGVPYLWP